MLENPSYCVSRNWQQNFQTVLKSLYTFDYRNKNWSQSYAHIKDKHGKKTGKWIGW